MPLKDERALDDAAGRVIAVHIDDHRVLQNPLTDRKRAVHLAVVDDHVIADLQVGLVDGDVLEVRIVLHRKQAAVGVGRADAIEKPTDGQGAGRAPARALNV